MSQQTENLMGRPALKFAVGMALILVFILLSGHFACELMFARGRTTVSPVVKSTDGTLSAYVDCQELWCAPGEGPVECRWYLCIEESSGGRHECEIGSYEGCLQWNELVELSFELLWDEPSRVVAYASNFRGGHELVECAGKAYFLGTCVRAPRKPTLLSEWERKPLAKSMRSRLVGLDLPDAALDALSFIQLEGSYCGTRSQDFLNEREDVLIVLGPDFVSHGEIVSFGPVLCVGSANPMGSIGTSQWVFFDDDSCSPYEVAARRIYAAGTAHVSLAESCKEPSIVR